MERWEERKKISGYRSRSINIDSSKTRRGAKRGARVGSERECLARFMSLTFHLQYSTKFVFYPGGVTLAFPEVETREL